MIGLDKIQKLKNNHNKELEKSINKLTTKYNLERHIIRDIIEEGNDICCNYFEDQKGNIKEILINQSLDNYLIQIKEEIKDINFGEIIIKIHQGKPSSIHPKITKKPKKL